MQGPTTWNPTLDTMASTLGKLALGFQRLVDYDQNSRDDFYFERTLLELCTEFVKSLSKLESSLAEADHSFREYIAAQAASRDPKMGEGTIEADLAMSFVTEARLTVIVLRNLLDGISRDKSKAATAEKAI